MAKQKIDPQYVDQLIQYIGGRANISTVTHCITRLRFVLKLISPPVDSIRW